MREYYTALVCKNGHVITRYLEDQVNPDKFCPECGQPTISTCSRCQTPIRGEERDPMVIFLGGEPSPPASHCPNCGTPYPWVRKTPQELPEDVPEDLKCEYLEACTVLNASPKASAALSRRCLQNLLRNYVNIKPSNLSDEIEAVLPSLPTELANEVDAIRNIGNFAAHPNKSQSTGDIIDVEPGEAEWSLEVLAKLLTYYFSEPSEDKAQALNSKLQDAGKPPMKKADPKD